MGRGGNENRNAPPAFEKGGMVLITSKQLWTYTVMDKVGKGTPSLQEEVVKAKSLKGRYFRLLLRSFLHRLLSPVPFLAGYAPLTNLLYGRSIDMLLRTSQKGLGLMRVLIRFQRLVSLSLTRHCCTNYSKEFFQRSTMWLPIKLRAVDRKIKTMMTLSDTN